MVNMGVVYSDTCLKPAQGKPKPELEGSGFFNC